MREYDNGVENLVKIIPEAGDAFRLAVGGRIYEIENKGAAVEACCRCFHSLGDWHFNGVCLAIVGGDVCLCVDRKNDA